MTELSPILARLGLGQYLQSLIDEGFDTWETLLDITESDLDALNVKLGHRRRLQREIISARGATAERLLASPKPPNVDSGTSNEVEDATYYVEADGKPDLGGVGVKRKYRRHPKADEHAPGRPPSAYVIFSNKIREELKPLNLSFTDIAKRVGEAWQVLLSENKDPYESQASAAKEKYQAAMAMYRKTEEYKDYTQYLADFKIKNASNAEGKRACLEAESSASRVESIEHIPKTRIAGRRRESMSSCCMESTSSIEHLSQDDVPVTMAPPTRISGPSSAIDAWRSASLSPRATAITDHGPPLSPREVLQNQAAEEGQLDRNKDQLHGQGLPWIVPFENSESHILLRHAPTDQKVLQDRSNSLHNLKVSNRMPPSLISQGSSISPKTSSLYSSAQSSASYTPLTPMEEGRSPISLPPLSTVTLGCSPLCTQGNNSPYNLPPRLHSPFLLSPSSDDAYIERGSLKNMTLASKTAHLSVNHDSSPREGLQNRPFLHKPSRSTLERNRDQKPNLLDEDYQHEIFLNSHADPLSVLAYAGRIVDRETR